MGIDLTNDLMEYLQHAQVFRQVSPGMVNQAYSENAKRRKENRRKQFFSSIPTRILSQYHAIKTGGPILVIGKAAFSSTIKGKCSKISVQILQYY
jgi:hypothetical protein